MARFLLVVFLALCQFFSLAAASPIPADDSSVLFLTVVPENRTLSGDEGSSLDVAEQATTSSVQRRAYGKYQAANFKVELWLGPGATALGVPRYWAWSLNFQPSDNLVDVQFGAQYLKADTCSAGVGAGIQMGITHWGGDAQHALFNFSELLTWRYSNNKYAVAQIGGTISWNRSTGRFESAQNHLGGAKAAGVCVRSLIGNAVVVDAFRMTHIVA
jgi:hypothetical protein